MYVYLIHFAVQHKLTHYTLTNALVKLKNYAGVELTQELLLLPYLHWAQLRVLTLATRKKSEGVGLGFAPLLPCPSPLGSWVFWVMSALARRADLSLSWVFWMQTQPGRPVRPEDLNPMAASGPRWCRRPAYPVCHCAPRPSMLLS